MKCIYKMILLLLIGVSPAFLQAQSTIIQVKGTVVGEDKLPISDAIVNSTTEPDNEVKTDASGVFTISVPINAPLAITAKGFQTRYLTAAPDLGQIALSADITVQEVQMPFRKVKSRDLLGGVSAVNVPALLEKNYFTYALDGMEAFAPGFNGNSNWGMGSYLLMIDGVPREVGNVVPTEIDQIVFLKGAAAVALYGSRASKGVINITTKRGEANNRKLNFRVNSGVNVPKSFPKYLGSAEYMTLYNEARRNDGLAELYSPETIYNYGSGKNPYRYPNVDFYSPEYIKNAFGTFDVTAEISGGNERARYYTNIGYARTGSLLNFGAAEKFNNSDRLNFRGNIDVNLNEFISLNVDATGIFYTGRGVNTDYWGSAANIRPNRISPLIPINMIEGGDSLSNLLIRNSNNIINGKYLLGGTQLDQTNPFAAIYAGGNNSYTARQFQFGTGIKADLRKVLQGLSFRTNLAIDYATAYSLSYNYTYATYSPNWNNYSGTDMISNFAVYGQDSKSGQQNVSGNFYRQTIALSGQLNYDRTFGGKHNVTAMALVNAYQQSTSAVYQPVNNTNLGFLVSYNLSHKYYVDLNGAYIYSTRLPKDNRKALSPTATVGWRISEEQFLKNSSVVDDLKLFASAGILRTDLDINNYYLYQGFYTVAGQWYGWKDGTGIQATESRRGDNPNMIFPKRREISAGFEGSFFKRTLSVSGSFFINEIAGNIIQASVLFPSYFSTNFPVSSFIPYINYNVDKRVGFDFGIALNKKTGSVNWSLGVNGTYYNTKAEKRAELFENKYQNRQDRPLDAIWGLQNLGFFQDQSDITNSPAQSFGQVRPGDIKYKDQNGDGLIDTRDEVFLGKGGWFGSPFTTGIHLTAQWKKLTFFALGVGRFGASGMRNNSYFWVDGEDKYSAVVRDRWTEATKNTATYPRLTTRNSDNNFRSSDFWLYKTNRFDLNRVQISYDLSNILKHKSMLKQLGVYVSGSGLLTLSESRSIMELNIGGAPQTRFYNVGVKAQFQ